MRPVCAAANWTHNVASWVVDIFLARTMCCPPDAWMPPKLLDVTRSNRPIWTALAILAGPPFCNMTLVALVARNMTHVALGRFATGRALQTLIGAQSTL